MCVSSMRITVYLHLTLCLFNHVQHTGPVPVSVAAMSLTPPPNETPLTQPAPMLPIHHMALVQESCMHCHPL